MTNILTHEKFKPSLTTSNLYDDIPSYSLPKFTNWFLSLKRQQQLETACDIIQSAQTAKGRSGRTYEISGTFLTFFTYDTLRRYRAYKDLYAVIGGSESLAMITTLWHMTASIDSGLMTQIETCLMLHEHGVH